MDLGNGRERVEVAVTLPTPLVFTLPYSEEEILFLTNPNGNGLGIIYNPRKIAEPVPWKDDCPHCLRGSEPELDVNVKRAVKVLASRRLSGDIEEYKIPTNGNPCTLWCKRSSAGLIVKILRPNSEPVDNVWRNGKFIVTGSDAILESKILKRSLRLLSSVRNSSIQEASACLSPLIEKQRREGIATHRRLPCLKITWDALLSP
jgi:hypothetical protein